MDEIKLGKQQDRGLQAQALLESEAFRGVFEYLHGEYLKAWRDTAGVDVQGRERIFQAVNTLDKIQDHLRVLVQRGNLAARDLADMGK